MACATPSLRCRARRRAACPRRSGCLHCRTRSTVRQVRRRCGRMRRARRAARACSRSAAPRPMPRCSIRRCTPCLRCRTRCAWAARVSASWQPDTCNASCSAPTMRADDPNLPILLRVAEALGDLRDELVFVGGCAAGLLLTDPVVSGVRATEDVDAIVEAASFTRFHAVEARLAERGFVRDADSGVICRWKHRASGTIFDLMPSEPGVLGFANRWYPEAVRSAIEVALSPGLRIHLISAPAF